MNYLKLNDENFNKQLDNLRFEILEKKIKHEYLYTRRVNIPMLELMQTIHPLDNSLEESFKVRGGFKNEQ